jgi:hypothetical protein
MQKITLNNISITVPYYSGRDPYNRKRQTGTLVEIIYNTPSDLIFKIMFDEPDINDGYTGLYNADLWLER